MTGFDSIHGADQKAAPYWSKIYVAFVELSGSTDRTEKAIRNQWGKMQAQFNLFIGVHATIVAVERSGWVPDDYINASLDLAKGSQNESCDTEGGDDPDQHDRPLGTKSAKRAKLVQCADDDRRARSIEVKEALVKSQVHRNKLIEEQNLVALITMTAPPGDEVAAKILDLKKRQALRMLEEDSFET
ncbi:hypothetical protein B5M09_013689 [Aphanomyces astaci]|uniref:No apical meristem-associated C-terminal domain-containing protein n=1 Tax=Aphanomyces astaci TaxID=112090 RepID=A0A425C5G8_APHAT|nr:hypothetical protein B5M09_013689 [Aphanomyces astaci]